MRTPTWARSSSPRPASELSAASHALTTTRRLLADNAVDGDTHKPLSVGFWFSWGHSTIVFALAFLLSVAVKALAEPVENDGSALHSVTGVLGASVSGVFLWILGVLNFVVLL